MKKPEYHFLVCNSFRISGEAQGMCHKKEAKNLLQYLEEEILDRGIDGMVSSTGCLKICEKGPVMVVHPANVWYGNISTSAIDDILDGIEEGELIEEYRL